MLSHLYAFFIGHELGKSEKNSRENDVDVPVTQLNEIANPARTLILIGLGFLFIASVIMPFYGGYLPDFISYALLAGAVLGAFSLTALAIFNFRLALYIFIFVTFNTVAFGFLAPIIDML
ncbi:hypothetical protein [Oligella urethralis]|uniref:Uncharacterized protein n=1 Tax=Oligella urethralis TaxID=90245 RepID=A0A2X1UMN6_9BURK|nr:hypothetical protein [Oligella urethralis]SPY08416.1 Uncharacterised protein [Oligella urethralis]